MNTVAYAAASDSVNEETSGTVTLKATNVSFTKSEQPQTQNVLLYADKNIAISGAQIGFALESPNDNVTIGTCIPASNMTGGTATNVYWTFASGSDVNAPYNADLDGYVLLSVPVTVAAGTTGTFSLKFTIDLLGSAFGSAMGTGYTLDSSTVTAPISVTEPVAEPEDYEIYYTLDSTTDEVTANYKDYQISTDTNNPTVVTATIKLKNNTATALTLQAYDIYLDYHAGLKYASHAMTGAIALVDGSNTEAAADDAVTHIEAVSDTYKNSSANKTLPANGELELGSVSFTIDPNNGDVKYGTPLNIGFELATDATNSANVTGITNFSVGSEETGDKKSYYPLLTGDTLGAEVVTTYPVTYDANTTDSVTGMPEAETKQYNVDLPLSTTVPNRDGYSFLGWSTEPGENNSEGIITTYTGNEEEILYAAWKQESFTIIFVDEDGETVLKTEADLKYGDMPTPPTVSNKEDEKYTYTFTGWDPTVSAVTQNQTYTATYEATPRTYTITLNKDNGEYADGYTAPSEYTYGTSQPLPTAEQISKPGYTFGGWYETDPNAIVTEVPADAYGNKTYNAKWNANKYIITFKDENTVLAAKEYTTAIETDIQSLYTATKTGYQFKNWQVSVTEGNWPEVNAEVAASETVTGKYGNVTLTAVWSEDAYSITYNLDGGNVAETNPTTYGVNTEAFTLNNPTKTGYTFLGWTGSNGTEPQKEVTIDPSQGLGDRNYTANWQINKHSITFKDGETNIQSEDLEYGAPITAPTAPEKTGYTFKGWDSEVPTTMPDSALVFTAQWEANTYKITLNSDKGNYVEGYTAPNEYTYDTVQKLPGNDDIKEPGYTLVGWYEEDSPDKIVTEVAVGEIDDKTYYAKWEANTYTITFNKEDGTLLEEVEFTFGATSIDEPAVPAKNGYTGIWSGYDLTKPENQIVTPVYTIITYTITYNPANGSATWTEQYTVENAVTIANAPTNGLYKFAGWIISEADGSWAEKSLVDAGSTYAQGACYGDVTLTAKWDIPFTYAVEEYKYAYTDYVMLRIATESNVNPYSFDGEKMFYTDDPNYQLDVEVVEGETKTIVKRNVFVTLIPKMGNVPTNEEGDITKYELTSAAMEKLTKSTANDSATVINRNGDVNGDTVVNIADANVVYQMVKINGGYYSMEQLDTYHRLVADMNTAYTEGDYRGTTTDVDKIVNQINGVAETN